MAYICKNCQGTLIAREPQNSRGETLWDCIDCGEKWQSRNRYGFIHFYQQGKKLSKRGRKNNRVVRTYKDQDEKANRHFGGLQKYIDRLDEIE